VFPVFEALRPIPPLAWVPAAIIFWPTQELSIMFVTFLGAFYAVVINVIDGARAIDMRYYQAARSMGSSSWDVFRRIILPGTLPRPRRLEELIENDDANLIKMQVLSLLHEEAMKSFARGSKAAADFIDAYSRRIRKPS
jgi:Binding-protein-dependent transport system inner membrane component